MIPGVSSLILPLPVFKAETQKMCRKTFYVVSVVMDSAADKRYAAYQELSGALKRFEESVSTKANIPSGCPILWLKP